MNYRHALKLLKYQYYWGHVQKINGPLGTLVVALVLPGRPLKQNRTSRLRYVKMFANMRSTKTIFVMMHRKPT